MRYTPLLLLSLVSSILLTGCEPYAFGIPQSQFNALTPEQRTEVIKGYNQRIAYEAQNPSTVTHTNNSSSASVVVNNPPPPSTVPSTPPATQPTTGIKTPDKESRRPTKPTRHTPSKPKPESAAPTPQPTPAPEPTPESKPASQSEPAPESKPAPQPEPAPTEPKPETPTSNETSNTETTNQAS